MPILGTIASSYLQSTTSYWAIDSYTVGSGGVTNFTFTSIPQTYKHLQIRYMARGLNTGTTGIQIQLRPNSDTSSTYYVHGMQGNKSFGGSSSYSSEGSNNTTGDFYWFTITAADATSNTAGIGVIDILDYTSTNKKKTIKLIGGFERSTFGQNSFQSMLWTSTAAISSLRLSTGGGSGFAQGSVFGLYGIKG